MEQDVYAQFLQRASELSEELHRAIAEIGPIYLPEREDHGLAHFLARAVVGQQLSTKAARSIWRRVEGLAESRGMGIPQCFMEGNEEALRRCGVSKNKVRTLLGIRKAEVAGLLFGEKVRGMDHRSRTEHLVGMWGIGQWTCDMVSIFYCRDPDVWPTGDVAVQRTFANFMDGRKSSRALRLFVPYRSYLALYMWRVVDGTP